MALTVFGLGHYHHGMDAELTKLETRLNALLDAFQALRTENRTLNARVASLQTENRHLNDKVRIVTERIEHLLTHLPTEEDV